MSDAFLRYYNQELGHIRRRSAEFAAANPKVAGHLRLSPTAVDDPHVARIIEAFAYLTARVRLKLDDDFPELTDALLGVLYPHHLAPIPSTAILQFRPKPELDGPFLVPAETEVESEPVDGESCRFRTTTPVELWPVQVVSASLAGRPCPAPENPAAAEAKSILRLTLACSDPDVTFTDLGVDRLRFFINLQPQVAFRLYELLFNQVLSVALADGPEDKSPVLLDPARIGPVGFETDEGVLPYSPRSFLGYRLLTELFAFPEKFLFFDLSGLSVKSLRQAGTRLEIFFYLDCPPPDGARLINAGAFALGCTPIINLFRQTAEPILLDHSQTEYHVLADARRPQAREIYSIDQVSATSPAGEQAEFLPLYGTHHGGGTPGQHYWFAARRGRTELDRSSEMYLSLVDLALDPSVPADWTVSVETTCSNRDLPARLPYGGGHPRFILSAGSAPVFDLACLTPPSRTLRPQSGNGARWRLISQLSLNHLSLLDGPEPADALREILALYDLRDAPETRAIIDSVHAIDHRRGTARAPIADMPAICRGIDIDLTLDRDRAGTLGMFLPAAVLERFFALYCSINSFTRLTLRAKGRAEPIRRFPARAGARLTL